MKIIKDKYQIATYTDEYRAQILDVWERSSQATHRFLKEHDFLEIKKLVLGMDFNQFNMYCLMEDSKVIGFLGLTGRKVEMLFLLPDYIGNGLGKHLMDFATQELGADLVDVNEQNKHAAQFYLNYGFETYERTEKDDQGNDYPLLRMKLK